MQDLCAEQRRNAVLDERARIAREIHDVLAHSLAALNIQIQTARSLLAYQEPERADDILAKAQRMSTDGLAETRRAAHALRTDFPSLPEALTRMTGAHQERHHASVTLHVEGVPAPLPPEQILCLMRTAQECLTNAAKPGPKRAARRPQPPRGEILTLVARGLNNTSELFLSNNTIKTHINRIFTKTGSRDRVAATHYAHRHNLD